LVGSGWAATWNAGGNDDRAIQIALFGRAANSRRDVVRMSAFAAKPAEVNLATLWRRSGSEMPPFPEHPSFHPLPFCKAM
jgi:hypothetical protein